jgi:hypothetical protein
MNTKEASMILPLAIGGLAHFTLPCSGLRRTNNTASSSPGAMNSWEGLGSLTPFTVWWMKAAAEVFLRATPLRLPANPSLARDGLQNRKAGGPEVSTLLIPDDPGDNTSNYETN